MSLLWSFHRREVRHQRRERRRCWNRTLIHSYFSHSHARTEVEDDEQHTHDNGDERPGRTDGLYVGFYSISRTRLNSHTRITRTLIGLGWRSTHATHYELHAHERALLLATRTPRSEPRTPPVRLGLQY
jgi:hypothetical protein